MNNEPYKGLSNRPTYLVELWLNEDKGLYIQTIYTIRHAKPDQEAAKVEQLIRDMLPATGMARDLIGYALSQVNWQEIVSRMDDHVDGMDDE